MTVGARLQPGVTLDQANAALVTVSGPILHQTVERCQLHCGCRKGPFPFRRPNPAPWICICAPLFRKPLMAMFLMCGGILLLGCLNLASLLMARSAARAAGVGNPAGDGRHPAATDPAIADGEPVHCGPGNGGGMLAAPLVSRSLAALLMSSNICDVQLDTSLDLRVFGFAAIVAVVSAVLIGLCLRSAPRRELNDHIKDAQHARQPSASGFCPASCWHRRWRWR